MPENTCFQQGSFYLEQRHLCCVTRIRHDWLLLMQRLYKYKMQKMNSSRRHLFTSLTFYALVVIIFTTAIHVHHS